MRVCLLCPELYPFAYGGIGVATHALALVLTQAGHAVTLLARKPEKFDPGMFQAAYGELELVLVETGSLDYEAHDNLHEASCFARRFWAAAQRRAFDLLVAPDCRAPAFLLLRDRLDGLRPELPPVVVMLHGSMGEVAPRNRQRIDARARLTFAMEDFCLAAADACIAPTRMMRDAALTRQGVSAAKIAVIPNCQAPTPPLRNGAPSADPARPRRIVFAGRLEYRKGADLLLEAFARLRQDRPDLSAQLILLGRDQHWEDYGGSFAAHWQERLPAATRSAVRFAGFTPHKDVLAAFSQADVCVFPSRFEPFGMVALEAMGQGAAVIVSGPGTGIDEVVGAGNGLFFDPASGPQGLRDALETLLDDPDLQRRLGANAARRAAFLVAQASACATAFFEERARRQTPPPASAAAGQRLRGQIEAILAAYRQLALAAQTPPPGRESLERLAARDHPSSPAAPVVEEQTAPAADLRRDLQVLLLFHDNLGRTVDCLKDLLPSGAATTILNHGSSPQARQALGEFLLPYPWARILDCQTKLGPGAGKNRLAAQTESPWLLFLDDGARLLTPDWLQGFAAAIDAHPEAEVFVPTIRFPGEKRRWNLFRLGRAGNDVAFETAGPGDANCFPGAAFLCRRELIARLGGFDEDLPRGFELLELCLRAFLGGAAARVVGVAAVEALHAPPPALAAVWDGGDPDVAARARRRLEQRRPDLGFGTFWRQWDQTQAQLFFSGEDRALNRASPETGFGCRLPVPTVLTPPDAPLAGPGLESLLAQAAARRAAGDAAPLVLLTAFARIDPALEAALPVQRIRVAGADAPGHHPLYGRDGCRFADMDALFASLAAAGASVVVLAGCLEYLEDPGPLLRALKGFLLNDPAREALVYCACAGQARPWRGDEARQFLAELGFAVDPAALPPDGDDVRRPGPAWLRLDRAAYDRFLAARFLPPASVDRLLLTTEHTAAACTGGIGAYAAAAVALSPEGKLAVGILSRDQRRPDAIAMRQRRFLSLERFSPLHAAAGLPTEETALALVLRVLAYYPLVRQIECQDIEAPALRLLQARDAGLLPSGLSIRATLHGPLSHLERGAGHWCDLDMLPLLEKEKIALEKADCVVSPTAFLLEDVRLAGARPETARTIVQGNPFQCDRQRPPVAYRAIDSLIFFGKRHPYKGFDLFAQAVRRVREATPAVRRILLLGPRHARDMQAENQYFQMLSEELEVVAYDLPHDAALDVIAANADRALCILPYKNDNYPYSVLEAINCRCRVLAAAAGGIPEMLPAQFHEAVLFPLSAARLADKILAAMALPAARAGRAAEELSAALAEAQDAVNAAWATLPARTPPPRPRTNLGPDALTVAVYVAPESSPGLAATIRACRTQSLAPARALYLLPQARAAVLSRDVMALDPDGAILAYPEQASRAQALELARKATATPLLAVIEAGTVPLRSFFRDALDCCDADPNVAAAVGYAARRVNDGSEDAAHDPRILARPLGDAGVLSGLLGNVYGHAAPVFRVAALDAVGGFPAGPADCDDPTLWLACVTLRAHGFRIGVAPRLNVVAPRAAGWDFAPDYPLQRAAVLGLPPLSPFDAYRLPAVLDQLRAIAALFPNTSEQQAVTQQLASMHERILRQDALILERWDAMQAMQSAVVERDQRLAAQDALVLERWDAMQAMQSAVVERDQRIAAQGEAMQAMEQRIAAYEAALWRRLAQTVIHGIRRVIHGIRRRRPHASGTDNPPPDQTPAASPKD